MKDMIKFLKLCKYSFKFKTNCIFLIIFFIIGVINEVATKGTQYLGGFYIVLTSIYLFQFVDQIGISGIMVIQLHPLDLLVECGRMLQV